MNGLAVSIVHPAFENFKKLGRFLHLVAAALLLINAFTQWRQPGSHPLFFWCQLIIAADILILVFAGNNIVQELPKINLVFRFIECVMFIGVALLLLLNRQLISGITLATVSTAYWYLFYCERKATLQEFIAFHHTGISVAGIPEVKFFLWTQIQRVNARYDCIHIETSSDKTLQFNFRRNLQFEELEQIHEFCRHYLGQTS